MKVYNVKVEAQMQFHFPVVARDSVEAERIVHELCGVNGVDSEKGECFGRKEKAEIAKEGADFAPIHNDAKYFNTLPEFFYGNRLKKGLELGILLAWSMCRYCLKGWYTLC